jgi:flagellar protein FlbD
MIQLTRLNRSSVTVNPDLIKLIEQSPDTVITLVNGEKLLVRETIDEILDRVIKFRRSIVHGPGSSAAPDPAASPEALGPPGTYFGKAGS